MALEYEDICGCPLTSFLAAPEKETARIGAGHESLSRRCLFTLQLFGLNSSLPKDLAIADPASVVLLPFHNPSYPFNLSHLERADDWEACIDILCSFGISSFLDLFWEDRSLYGDNGASADRLTRLGIRPPRMDEVRAYHPKVAVFDVRARRHGFYPPTAFAILHRNWPKLLRAWPAALVDLFVRFVEAHPNFDGSALRGHSLARPHADRFVPNLPFASLTITAVPLKDFRARVGRAWYYGSKCAMPGHPDNDYMGLHANNVFLRPGASFNLDADDEFETIEEPRDLPSASSWRIAVVWKSIWPFLHKLQLPGIGRASWWLILHWQGSVTHTVAYKVAHCPGCCEVASTSDHIYLECPHFRRVWLAMADVVVAVAGEPIDLKLIKSASPGAVALGFLIIYSSLQAIGHTRFKVWVSIAMAVMMSAVRNLPRGDAVSTPPSLDPTRLQTQCVKELFRFTCLFHAGPARLPAPKFNSHWLVGNQLIFKKGDRLLMHNIGLIPDALIAQPQDLIVYGDQTQPSASTSIGTTMRRMRAPAQQDWSKDRKHQRRCRCCATISPVWERTTVLCAGCFVIRFPDTDLDPAAHRSYNTMKRTCKTCNGGEGARAMTWSYDAKDFHCKCCGKQRLRMERKSQTCWGCFERNTGQPLLAGFPSADKHARPCRNCPPAQPALAGNSAVAGPLQPRSSGVAGPSAPPV